MGSRLARELELEAEVDRELAEAVRLAEAAPEADEPTTRVYARDFDVPEAATEVAEVPTGPEVNLITAVNRALDEALATYERALVFGEDVGGKKGGVFKATQGLSERFGERRCFNTPLAEASIIGAAVGMAAYGLYPIPEIQFADYIHPAFDQIVSEVARVYYRSDGKWSVPMVIRTPYGAGIHGA